MASYFDEFKKQTSNQQQEPVFRMLGGQQQQAVDDYNQQTNAAKDISSKHGFNFQRPEQNRVAGINGQLSKNQQTNVVKEAPKKTGWARVAEMNARAAQAKKSRPQKSYIDQVRDIMGKWGIDFSQDYDDAVASMKKEEANRGLRQLAKQLSSSSSALDHNYFQKYMNQAQNQVNNGINAGIASDQNLRLSMARQENMADIYNRVDARKQQYNDIVSQVDSGRMSKVGRQDRLNKLYNQGMSTWDLLQNQGIAEMQDSTQRRGQDLDMVRFEKQDATQRRGQDFDFNLGNRRISEDSRQFDLGLDWQKDSFAQEMDWNREQFNNLSAAEKEKANQFYDSLQEQIRQYDGTMNWNREQFNNISKTDMARLIQDQTQFEGNLGLQYDQLEQDQVQFTAKNELAWAKFNKPYEELTQYEQAQLDLQYDRLGQDDKHFGEQMANEYQGLMVRLAEMGLSEDEIMAVFGMGGQGGNGPLTPSSNIAPYASNPALEDSPYGKKLLPYQIPIR